MDFLLMNTKFGRSCSQYMLLKALFLQNICNVFKICFGISIPLSRSYIKAWYHCCNELLLQFSRSFEQLYGSSSHLKSWPLDCSPKYLFWLFLFDRLRGKLNLDIIIHKTSYNKKGIYQFYNVLQIYLEFFCTIPPPPIKHQMKGPVTRWSGRKIILWDVKYPDNTKLIFWVRGNIEKVGREVNLKWGSDPSTDLLFLWDSTPLIETECSRFKSNWCTLPGFEAHPCSEVSDDGQV